MTNAQKINGRTSAMRWTARILAIATAGLFAYFVIEFGPRIFPNLSWGAQGIPLLAVVGMAVIGTVLAWRWELLGGALTLGGALVTMILVCAGSGLDMFLCALFFALPLLVAGALYLSCCWQKRVIRLAKKA